MSIGDERVSGRLRLVRAEECTSETAQTGGMARTAALAAATVGSQGLWMGLTRVEPDTSSAAHHHGHSETGIYVVEGTPVFSYREGADIVELHAAPGDFVYVPPFVAHVESNVGDTKAVVVIARSTQEAIVENLEAL